MGELRSDMLASLMYTSGTTGTPKGVRHTHASWTYEGTAIAAQDILGPDDLQYLWLPLSHSFGKVLLSTQMACGFPTAVDGDVDRIIDNLAVIQPTFMGAAPRIFEKAHSRIVAMQDQDGGIKRRVFEQAFAVARRRRSYLDEGRRVPYLLGKQYDVLDKASSPRSASASAPGCASSSPVPPPSTPTSASSSTWPASRSWRATD